MVTIVVYLLLLIALTPPLGAYMYRVYTRERIGRIEGVFYRRPRREPRTPSSPGGGTPTSLAVVQRDQHGVRLPRACAGKQHLPLNPEGLAGVNPYLAFNTAASFMTNTNWQSYGGETTMSYLSQMLALTFQNFVSAAVGIAVADRDDPRDSRAPAPTTSGTSGATSCAACVYVLLPLAVLVAIVLMTPGRRRRPSAPSASSHRIQGVRPVDRAGPGREPDRDQAARHERRRVLQRELRAPVRERDAAVELRRDVRDPAGSPPRSPTRSARWSATSGRAGCCSR